MKLLALAIRSHRTGLIALALIGAISGLVNGIAFVEVAGHTQLERQACPRGGARSTRCRPG